MLVRVDVFLNAFAGVVCPLTVLQGTGLVINIYTLKQLGADGKIVVLEVQGKETVKILVA